MQEETGAVLMGRRTFEMAGDTDSHADTYELQVPIFVLTHEKLGVDDVGARTGLRFRVPPSARPGG